MLGVGPSEMVLVAIIALVVIGPEKFPEVAKIVLRTFRDVRGYMDDVKGELRRELQPVKKEIDQVSRQNPEDLIEAITGESLKDDDKPSDYDKKNDPYGYAAQEKSAAQDNAQGAATEQKPAETSLASSSSSEWDEFADQKSEAAAEPVAQATSTDSQPPEPAANPSVERLDG